MHYQEFLPEARLRPYIKCYYIIESSSAVPVTDKAFATGCMEVMFNLGTGHWQIASGDNFVTNPRIELWGQVIQPLAFRTNGNSFMLGIRFFPHTAACLLDDDVKQFNDRVVDFHAVAGRAVHELYEKLLEAPSLQKRLSLMEAYMLRRLERFEGRTHKIALIDDVVKQLRKPEFFDGIDGIASRYGISSRYLQKIFLRYTGLTPKLYSKINRFQTSLVMVSRKQAPLTAIAYDCGYFDQSHFIREFKAFTGVTPSAYDPHNSSALLMSPNK